MHVTLRRYADAGARVDEIGRKVEQGLVPILRDQEGFRLYGAFASEAGDAVSISVFDRQEQGAQAHERARGWVQAELRDLLPDPPEVFAGETGFAELSPGLRDGARPFVVIRKFEGLGPMEATREVVRKHTAPVITGSPGFLAFLNFRDSPTGTRGAVVTLFDTRDNAIRSHERIVAVLREHGSGVVPAPSRVLMGQAIIIALAR